MKYGKKYSDSIKAVDVSKYYDVNEAVKNVLATAKAKFDETIELHVRLGVDPVRRISRFAARLSFPTAPVNR